MPEPKKRMVSSAAIKALQATIDALPPNHPARDRNLLCTGGALEDLDLDTDLDWILYRAAFALGWRRP